MDETKYTLEYDGYRCVVRKYPEEKSPYWGYVVNVPMIIFIAGKDIDEAYECLVSQIDFYKKYLQQFGRDGKGLWK